jgi:hypothetical protein
MDAPLNLIVSKQQLVAGRWWYSKPGGLGATEDEAYACTGQLPNH